MPVKIAALDLDGTTLDNRAQLSEQNKQAIIQAAKKGALVIPCTGRTNAEMPRELMELPQVRYCIMANGAKVLRMEDQKLLFSDCLDRKTAEQAISFASRYRCMCELYMDGHVFVEQHKLEDSTAYGVTPRIRELVENTRTGVRQLQVFFARHRAPVEKINVFFGDLEHRRQFLSDVQVFGNTVESTGSMETNAEINNKTATKGRALQSLAQMLGVKRQEVLAIGDSGNDLSMLSYAGIPLAVANASSKAKLAAVETLPPNDQNAVAYALKKYILSL